MLSSAYLHSPDARVRLEDAVGRLMPRARTASWSRSGSATSGSPSRSTRTRSWTWRGWTPAQATAKLLWALDRPAQPPAAWQAQAEEPRFPGTVPPIWNVPARNADFTGRGATLELLRDKLAGGGRAVVVAQALYGLGGVGKTQLALEYAHRFMADYDLVWWVPSERAEEISVALADLARKMGLKVGDNVAEAAEAALEELRRDTTPHWLLIFDNADDPKQLEPYLPTGIGSRPDHLAEPGLDAFGRAAGGGRLHQGGKRRASPAARARAGPGRRHRVAEALGHLPLAVEQASAWLEQTGMPARVYVEQLATQSTRILALNQPPDYPMPVVATWNLSFDRLSSGRPAAVRLLQLCAFFSPGPDLDGPALQRRDERSPCCPSTRR